MIKLLLHFRQAGRITKRHEKLMGKMTALHSESGAAMEYTKTTIAHLTEELGRLAMVNEKVGALLK